MSGFAGIVRIEPDAASAEADRAAVERMARAIAFRGPDSEQQTHQDRASFAFSFLKTGPAPQEASQPYTLDGETWLLGDVRCDGRDEIIRNLSQYGVEVPLEASSERLILQYFAKFGEDGLPKLDGDLTFVIWKPKQRKLIAFRDLTGARPFFYAHRNGVLVFSNTVQAVLAVPSILRELDQEFLADFLLGAPYHDPHASVYRGIRRLPPGHLLEFSGQGITIRRIASAPIEDVLILQREEEYVEEFLRLFRQAVRDHLPAIDTTILLSGGLDSTSIAACAVSERRRVAASAGLNLRAFSINSQPVIEDVESGLASRFAKSLGIPCNVVHSGNVLPFDGWEEPPREFPEPALDPYSSSYHSYYRRIARDSRVVFTGNGADELLRQRAVPYLSYLYRRDGALVALTTLTRYIVAQRKLPPLGAGIRSGMLRWLGKPSYKPSFPPWFNPEFERRCNLAGRWHSINLPAPSPHPFNPRAYAAVNDFFITSVLEFFDSSWTGCAVELRSPYLDRRLSRFLLRVPLVPWAMEKHLLRRSQIGILPDEIRLRPKTPVLQDPLLLQATSGKWNPVPSGPVTDVIGGLVDWPKLIGFIQQLPDESLYLHLRPLALARWLEFIENCVPIRYIL